jgi:imidazolonepropionase-like amidohydrolase
VDQWYYALNAAQAAKIYLSRGFTTVRDAAGNPFSVKMAIDEGMIVGPRIYPSGPLISQTSGHADHRSPNEPSSLLGGERDLSQKYGLSLVVDGVPQVLEAVRQQLFRGASQIKIAVSGGTGSESDPLDVVEFTPDEVRAAVQAAASWHTYVMAHAYAPDAIRMAVENGVKTIEHGNLIDEPTLQLMKDKGVWLSAQVSTYTVIPPGYTEDQARKHRQAYAGIDNMFKTAKKIGFDKIGFGTDIISNLDFLKRADEEFVLRTKWFTPAEILKQATYNNGQIVALSGPRNPYPGKLGVIEEGALADLLLINGDPLSDISILAKPEQNLSLIMKDGVIYKNAIDGRAVVAGL